MLWPGAMVCNSSKPEVSEWTCRLLSHLIMLSLSLATLTTLYLPQFKHQSCWYTHMGCRLLLLYLCNNGHGLISVHDVFPAANVSGFVCDVTKEKSVQMAVSAAEDKHGPATILVNAAGINRDTLLMRTSVDDMSDVINTNLIGSMITCKAVLKGMLQQRHGCIVNIGILAIQWRTQDV